MDIKTYRQRYWHTIDIDRYIDRDTGTLLADCLTPWHNGLKTDGLACKHKDRKTNRLTDYI